MKLTRIFHHIVSAFFIICIFANLFITNSTEVIQAVLRYSLWFSFGLLAGSYLVYYIMRKDLDNAHKQFEDERKNRPPMGSI